MKKPFMSFFMSLVICLPLTLPAEGPIAQAAERAAGFLLSRLGEEEMWVLPPQRTRRVVDRRQVEVRYREVEVEVPVYARETREVVVQRRADSSGAVAGLERRTIEVRGEQIGTRRETRLVRDPDGPIVRRENRNIMGPGGPDVWRTGQFGQNAKIAVALLRSQHPEAETAVAPMLDFFQQLITQNGMPDLTVDLAWISILFAESGNTVYQDQVPALLARLLAGQIREGPALGLWGPVATNPEILAGIYRRFWEASQQVQSLVERFGEEPTSPANRRQLSEATLAVEQARAALDQATWTHRTPDGHRGHFGLTDPITFEEIQVRRAPEYLFNQISADLESTMLALYAIRIGRDRGLLPAQLPELPPLPGPRRGITGPARSLPGPRQMLMDAAQAVARAGSPAGAFSEMNLHQPVRGFDDMAFFEGVPLPANVRFPELPSPVTLTATAQAYAAMVQVGRVLGMANLRAQAPGMVRAKTLLDAQFDRALEENSPLLGTQGFGVLNLGLALLDPGPEIPTAQRPLRRELAEHLLTLQQENGSWNVRRQNPAFMPTVTLARVQTLPFLGRSFRQFDYAQAFVGFNFERNVSEEEGRLRDRFGAAQPVLMTTVALLLLAEELQGTEVIEGEVAGE